MKRIAASFRALILAALLAPALPAAANDSVASISVGGLQLEKTDKIAMVSEDLFISTDQVRVRYVYRNLTKAPVTVRIAFPLPDITFDQERGDINYANPDEPNFVGFQTLVDGKPMAFTPDVRAFANGKDVTATLKAAGAPVMYGPNGQAALSRLDANKRAGLVKAGLLLEETTGEPGKIEMWYWPTWTMRTAFYRDQTFPVGKGVVVEHRYQPISGGSVGSLLAFPGIPKNDPDRIATAKRYCVDAGFEKGVAAILARKDVSSITEANVGYVLKTGANWARPIGDFRLVLDKGAAENLLSFCAPGPGVKKISPTRIEWRAKNFTPKQDIEVLILKPNKG